ncbi:MAG: hypothetical protein LBB82_10280 [Treponema sp.]|jgi:hypothetical protein|nr:hypothetical protein [Treponema sp.]
MKGNPRQFMTAFLFVYDCFRLFVLLTALFYLFNPGQAGIGGVTSPFLMYTAPNALFPLMSLFLLIRFEASKLYIPLYITGKLVALVCAAAWLIVNLRIAESRRLLFWALVAFADFASLMGVTLLKGEK